MLRIVNLRNYTLKENEILIKVDRSSILGNPYFMKDESERDTVCDKYQIYFDNKLNDEKFINELRRIYSIAKDKDVALGCWCYPKRCHAETIKSFLEIYL